MAGLSLTDSVHAPSFKTRGGPRAGSIYLKLGRHRVAYGDERGFEAGHIFVLALQGKAATRRQVVRLGGPCAIHGGCDGTQQALAER
jgi:hypothetical protein